MSSVLRRTGALSAVERHTVGDTKTSLVSHDHIGWLMCDGRALNVEDFRQLFSVIGYSFGGAGSTFNLPDPMGRVPGFVGSSGGNTWAMGDVSGTETHTLTIAEMPAHNHDISGADPSGNGFTSASATGITMNEAGLHSHTHNANAAIPGAGLAYRDGNNTRTEADGGQTNELNLDTAVALSIDPSGNHTHTINDPTHRHQIASNGGNQPHNNMQPTIFLGNLFVYAGRLFKDATTSNTYPPNGARNIY